MVRHCCPHSFLLQTFSLFVVMEEEYERKRWDRKFRKFRGRPKKRSKREVSNYHYNSLVCDLLEIAFSTIVALL